MEKIRSYTYTIEFEDAISKLTISAITTLIKVRFVMYVGAASSIASMVKAAYKKPDLKGKKHFMQKIQYMDILIKVEEKQQKELL